MSGPARTVNPGEIYKGKDGGELIVVEYINAKKILIEHLDEHRHKSYVQAKDLHKGTIKNPYRPSVYGVGYIGCGRFKATINGKSSQKYQIWNGMLERAYSTRFAVNYPTYDGVTVCEEWHNLQNFAEWCDKQPNSCEKGFDLDKDLLVPGNKEYGPKTCSFLPPAINSLLRSNLNKSPTPGVHRRGCSFRAQIGIEGKIIFLGRYSTREEATSAYREAKQDSVRKMAEKYRHVLNKAVYENLSRWRFHDENE